MSEQNFACNLTTGEVSRTDSEPGNWEGVAGPIVVATSYLAVKRAAVLQLTEARAILTDTIATIRSSRKGWL